MPRPEAPDDGRVIAASLEDPSHFTAIFERHHHAVRAYLVRRCGLEDGADLAAEVFVVAFRNRSRFETDRPDARPWLFGIASNLLDKHFTRRFRRGRAQALFEAMPDTAPAPTATAESRLDAAQQRSSLLEAVASLRPPEREALMLHAWGELTAGEVAEAIGIPVGTVNSRLSRARTQLRDALQTTRR